MTAGSISRAKLDDQPWLQAEATQRIIHLLDADGHQARFVGGCVRDSLLRAGLDDIDIDVATTELPQSVIARLDRQKIKVVPTGLSHGTVTAILNDRQFEITTLRQDVQTDGRHAEVEFTEDFDVDAARRDFTINALRADRHGKVVDPFDGVEDLACGRIRFVGDPVRRVAEDYLRILRYFRFFARFGQRPLDPPSFDACREEAHMLSHIAGERIQTEMRKLLEAANAIEALQLTIEAKVAQAILLPASGITELRRLAQIEPQASWQRRLALWLRSSNATSADLERIATRWRLANAELRKIERLCLERLPELAAPNTAHRSAIYRYGADLYGDLLLIGQASAPVAAADFEAAKAIAGAWQPPRLPLNGDDLVARGIEPGPELGQLLRELEDWWIEHDFAPDHEAMLVELQRRRD